MLLLTAAGTAAVWEGITVRRYTEISEKVAAPIRIVLLADLHSSIYGSGQKKLLQVIDRQHPDLLLLAGDIVDDKAPGYGAWRLLKNIGARYRCYYVSGNHEYRSGRMAQIKENLRQHGITVLEGSSQQILIRGQKICVAGVDDPSGFRIDRTASSGSNRSGWIKQLADCGLGIRPEVYTVLCSHHPECVADYQQYPFDLITCGHAHGGQVRIPGICNGLYAPHQGFFPKYAGGRYQIGHTSLIVSRGLCKNRCPRVFNPPEVVTIDILPNKANVNKKTHGRQIKEVFK